MATYHVTQGGANLHNGSVGNEWSAAEFNDSAKWNATAGAAGKICPSDTVNISGTITATLSPKANGLSGQPITLTCAAGSSVSHFNFNGKDYINLNNIRQPDNYQTGSMDWWIEFNAGAGNISNNCIIDGAYSTGKGGSGHLNVGYSNNTTIRNSSFVEFWGYGIESSGACDGLLVQDCHVETRSQAAPWGRQTDLIRPSNVTNCIIEGCLIRLKIDVIFQMNPASGKVDAGGAHDDCIQLYATGGVRPRNVTIRNNWLEIGPLRALNPDGTVNTTKYGSWNFFMNQNISDDWDYYGNIFYTHDWQAGSVMSGDSGCWYADPNDFHGRYYNNTCVSVRGGGNLFARFNSNINKSQTATNDSLQVANNIFYCDRAAPVPLESSIPSESPGTFVWKNNLICGWGNAYKVIVPATATTPAASHYVHKNTTFGDGGKIATDADIHFVSLANGSEDFSLSPDSIGKTAGSGAEVSGLTLPTVGQRSQWPGPLTRTAAVSPDIGAFQFPGSPITTRVIGLSGDMTFGNVQTGQTLTQNLTIKNTGNSTLAVSAISLPTGFTADWSSGNILAGASQVVGVTFSPVAVQAYSGNIVVTSNATSGVGTIACSGAGISATATRVIALSGSLAFGTVQINTTATRPLTITNNGNSTLTVSGITLPTGFSGSFAGVIAAGASQVVTVTFSPLSNVSYSGTVTVTSDATSGTSTTSASGTGGVKVIALSGNMTFGNITVGQTATRVLTVSNTGSLPLVLSSMTFPPGYSGNFTTRTVAAGGSTNINVTFSPIAVQSYTGNIDVTSDKTSGTNTIAVSGSGTATATKVIQLAGDLDFGSVQTGTSVDRTLTITNSGNATLTVSGITFPTGFSGDWSSGTIAAGASQVVNVTFAPVAAISYGGTVTVTSDATSGVNTTTASGTGSAAVTKVIALITGAGNPAFTFGNVNVGSSLSRTLVISNNGTAPLTVSGITYPAGYTGPFSGTIAPGGSQDVTVTLTPTAVQAYNGTITVASDATSGTGTIGTTGAGVVTATKVISISGDLNFGTVQKNHSVQRIMTISNSGTTLMTVSGITYPTGFSGAFSGPIPANAFQNVTVTFRPTAQGSYGGDITVASDKTSGVNTIACSGSGSNKRPVPFVLIVN